MKDIAPLINFTKGCMDTFAMKVQHLKGQAMLTTVVTGHKRARVNTSRILYGIPLVFQPGTSSNTRDVTKCCDTGCDITWELSKIVSLFFGTPSPLKNQ